MDIMEQYKSVVSFLGQALGEQCEIALLDLRENQRCITAIANGFNSGRAIGAPITDLALKVIASGEWKSRDYICGYDGRTKTGKATRSSSFFIKEGGELLGMLCININTEVYSKISSMVLELIGIKGGTATVSENSTQISETFSDSLADMIDRAIPDDSPLHNIPASRMTQNEKLDIVRSLYDNKVFLMKGAVSEVAAKLSCSEATIYRYLSRIEKEQNTD